MNIEQAKLNETTAGEPGDAEYSNAPKRERDSSFSPTAVRHVKPVQSGMTIAQLEALLSAKRATEESAKRADLPGLVDTYALAATEGDAASVHAGKGFERMKAAFAPLASDVPVDPRDKDGSAALDARVGEATELWQGPIASAFESKGIRPDATTRERLGKDYEEPPAFVLARQHASRIKAAIRWQVAGWVAMTVREMSKATKKAKDEQTAGEADRIDALRDRLKVALDGLREDGKTVKVGAMQRAHPLRVTDGKVTARRVRDKWVPEYRAKIIAALELAVSEVEAVAESEDVAQSIEPRKAA